jgi:hypothetical protein
MDLPETPAQADAFPDDEAQIPDETRKRIRGYQSLADKAKAEAAAARERISQLEADLEAQRLQGEQWAAQARDYQRAERVRTLSQEYPEAYERLTERKGEITPEDAPTLAAISAALDQRSDRALNLADRPQRRLGEPEPAEMSKDDLLKRLRTFSRETILGIEEG